MCNKENFKVIYDINEKDFCRIRENLKWNSIEEEQVKKAIQNSMINVSVFCDNLCVGVGRIVGDNVLKGMLTDVMVLKEYQGKGVGRLIVTNLINKLDSMVLKGDAFQLEASPSYGKRDFYVKCGMKYKPENQDGVYIWIKK